MRTLLHTVPKGVGAFCTERTFGDFFLLFPSRSRECALGAPWRGAGASVSARSPGRRAAAPPRVGAQTFSPGFRGGQRPTANSDVSLSRAPANPRSVQARGMGSSLTETWNPAARRRALRLGGVSAGQDPLGGQRSLAAEISTLSADQQPRPSSVLFQKLGRRNLTWRGRALSPWRRKLRKEKN